MTLDRAVPAFAGMRILPSLALAQAVSPWWRWFAAFIGANLPQSGVTGVCPAAIVFGNPGVPSGCAFQ
jgi:hypothetical protein